MVFYSLGLLAGTLVAKSFPNLVFCLFCFKIPPYTGKNVAVSLYITQNLYRDPLRAKADSIYTPFTSVCVCLEDVCKHRQTNWLEKANFVPKIEGKKLWHYFQPEASCSLIVLCIDLPPQTWQFCGKVKAELDPLCRCCRICIITNVKKFSFPEHLFHAS